MPVWALARQEPRTPALLTDAALKRGERRRLGTQQVPLHLVLDGDIAF
jgi:hypothetical protein